MARRRKGEAVSGWICLDKPLDLASTQAVGRVRRAFNAQKAGHAGTLDPLATGILPIALGEATKTVPFLMDADKTYRFTIAWGETTASFDREGAVTATSAVRPTRADGRGGAAGLRRRDPADPAGLLGGEGRWRARLRPGPRGRRAGPGAAHGEHPRLEIAGAPDADHIELEIDCGKGTYVRALVRDLAAALGACGHVSALRRTRVGPFGEDRAIGLEMLEELCHSGARLEALLPVETALDDIPALAVTTEDAFRLTQGRSIVLLPRQVEALKASAQVRLAHRLCIRGSDDRGALRDAGGTAQSRARLSLT